MFQNARRSPLCSRYRKINISIYKETDIDDYEELKALNEVIYTYEGENKTLKNEISNLKNQLAKEQVKSRELIPQYKASVERLKKNTQLVRDRLKEIQQLKHNEKIEFENKVKERSLYLLNN